MSSGENPILKYTSADLKISLYVRVRIKIVP